MKNLSINSQQIIYNGYNIREILSKMPIELRKFKLHRNMYIKNCIEVYFCEKNKTNLGHADRVRYSNFLFIQFYNK
jgi:hypothetical protein